ncbi:MAG: hypothetical protein JWM86_1138 [Thermoleophilia bacterium]|nr:hypothetical protein [Thermoleophilia bacterium]
MSRATGVADIETFADIAPWVAIAAAVVACAVVGWLAHGAWAAWKRVELTSSVANDLLATHGERLDASAARASEQVGVLADGGEVLAEELAELRRDVGHLRWMLRQIPETRERLQRHLIDLVLPTRDRKARDDG